MTIQYKNTKATSNGISSWEKVGGNGAINRSLTIPTPPASGTNTTNTQDGFSIVVTTAATPTAPATATISSSNSIVWQ